MLRPTWVTVIGVLMIIFGILGLVGNLEAIFAPKVVAIQQMIMDHAIDEAEYKNPSKVEMLQDVKEMMKSPPWFTKWMAFHGLLGAAIMILYFYAGLLMLKLRENAAKIAYWALGLSIAHAVIQLGVALFVNSLMAFGVMIAGLVSMVIDLVILAVILAHSKEAFQKNVAVNEVAVVS